ncbi:peptidylprolyl isomerase [Paracidobacterium acidisoli]|uniref:Peptidyl-prolyl cis-trans isomerase n=1 Tax=Paracidobacterium acidisoli TaxID=2303751 RepID=A0A372IUC7_9BACT|nr:peptidylprolyl isomerase [Paracidobacterium acidisoli]MBT9329976.1 peptidylprolyl isomerase [Paracidobacterium acidisoli]
MISIRRTALAFAITTCLALTAAAQQPATPQTPPATPAPASGQTPSPASTPASSQDLPDAPGAQPQARPAPEPTGPTAVLDTSMGRITCQLFSQQAPETVANFIGLAEGTKDWTDPVTKEKVHGKPFYDGTIFHRVIPDFMIQGGDRTGTGMGDPGYLFKDELNPDLNFDVPGRLAMANSGPDTNGSQFFITEVPTEWLNQKHTIFGQCDQHGILVAQSIAQVQRDRDDKPADPVVLKKVTIVPTGQPLPPPPADTTAPAQAPAAAPQAAPQQ